MSDLCHAGFKITSDPCPECGAKANELCGRIHIPLEAELAQLRAQNKQLREWNKGLSEENRDLRNLSGRLSEALEKARDLSPPEQLI